MSQQKLYEAVRSGRVKLTDLNDDGKQALREYMSTKDKPATPKQSTYSRIDSKVGGILPGGSDFKPSEYGISDKFAKDNPAISRGLATVVSPLKAVFDIPSVERASQAGNEVRFLTENPDKTDTGSSTKNMVADFIGGATGFIGGSPGSIMPSAGGALFGGGAKATGKILPKTTRPIVRTAAEMAGGSVVYDLGNAAANGHSPTVEDLGVVAAQNALLGAATYGLGKGVSRLFKDKTEIPLTKKEVTSPKVKQDIPADINLARNVVKNTTNLGRINRIIDAYPELAAEYPQFRLQQGDKVILPNGKEATVKTNDRMIIQVDVDGKAASVGRKVVNVPEVKTEAVSEVATPEIKQQPVINDVPRVNNRSGADTFDDAVSETVSDNYNKAVELVTQNNSPSISLLQRNLKIGYAEAARHINRMESEGIVSAFDGNGRTVLKQGNKTATDIETAFNDLGNAAQEAGYKKTMDDVAKQGYVSFAKKESADLFRNDPRYEGWKEEQVNGEYRFSPQENVPSITTQIKVNRGSKGVANITLPDADHALLFELDKQMKMLNNEKTYSQELEVLAEQNYNKLKDKFPDPIGTADTYRRSVLNGAKDIEKDGTYAAETFEAVKAKLDAEAKRFDIPVDKRTSKNVGDRKVNAMQYNHPELKPHIQEQAKNIMGDLAASLKAARGGTTVYGENTGGENISFGNKRMTTNTIAKILDEQKVSYADIDSALQRIIDDAGQENTALAKRIELLIDDHLTNGYTDIYGNKYPPNKEYVDAKNKAYGTDIKPKEQYKDMSDEDWQELEQLQDEMGKGEVVNKDLRKTQIEQSFAKEDWEVPKDIFIERGSKYIDEKPASYVHRSIVEQAFKEGKPVPPEVLKDYPELSAEVVSKPASEVKTIAEDIGLKPEKAYELIIEGDKVTGSAESVPEQAGTYDPGTIGAARLTPTETINTITSKTDKPPLLERLAPANIVGIMKKVYYKTVDGYNRINDFDKAVNKTGRSIPFNQRAYILAHNTSNAEAMARRTLEENMVDPQGNVIGAPLKDIVQQVPKGEWRKFEDYLKLKHYKAWENSDMEVYEKDINMSPEKADLQISKYDAEYPWMQQTAKNYTAWINQFGENWLVETGLISPESWSAMRTKYGDYVPMQRLMEDVEIGKTGAKGSFADQPNPVKRAKGSERKTIESLETMIERVPNYIKVSKRNEVMQRVIEGIRQDPEGMSIWGEIVDSNTANLTMPNIVAGRINGERVHVRMNDPALLDAISGLTPKAQNVVINTARSITSKMKLLTTGINPVFSLGRNVVRDLPMSYIASKSTNSPIEWSKDIVGALVDILGNKAAYRSYKDMGGGYASAVSTDVNVLAGSKAKLLPGYYDLSNIKNPVEYTRRLLGVPFKALEKLADVTEAVPRLGEYRRIIRKEGDSYTSRTKALYESKDITVNFQKKNTAEITNFLDTFIPYFGASVNGLDKLARIYKDNPVAAINKTFAAITVPTLMLYAMNYDNEDYQNLSSWVKDTNHLIPLPNGTFLKLPKPREGGVVFGALVERTLDSLLRDNPDAFYKFMDTVKASFLPPVRTIKAPISDIRANKDFINRPIVPKFMEGMSPGQQFDEKTSSFAKKLGESYPEKISPKQVDYLVKSYLGVIGQIGIPALSEGSTGDALKRIFTADSAYSSDTIQKFYDKKKEYDTIKADTKQTGDTIDPNDEKFRKLYGKVAEMISNNSNQARELRKNEGILEKQKDKQLRDIQLKNLILADIVNRPIEEQLKVYNDLKRKRYIIEEKPKSELKAKADQRRQQKKNNAIENIISQ